jgi:hypothetical protein
MGMKTNRLGSLGTILEAIPLRYLFLILNGFLLLLLSQMMLFTAHKCSVVYRRQEFSIP